MSNDVDRKEIRIVIAMAIAAMFALPMVGAAPLAAGADTLVTLRIGLMEPIDSLNPFIGVNDNAYIFYGLVYDYLISVDEDGKPSPALATSWHVVQDIEPVGSVWEYTLAQNATWHDGEPFDADDVVFTFELQIGVNFDLFWAFQPYTAIIKSVEKVDEYTVRLHYQDLDGNPTPCSFGDVVVVPIVPEHILGQLSPAEVAFGMDNEWPIGTGPFKCTDDTYDEFLRGERLILNTNRDYFLGEIDFDRLVLEFYLEPAAMVSDIQNGKIDVGIFASPNYKNLLQWKQSHPDAPIQTHAGFVCTSYSIEIDINMDAEGGENPSRTDPAVRRAMAHATNKTFIRDQVYGGLAAVGSALLSPLYGEWYWEPNETELIEYNITKANDVLETAGYEWRGNVRVAPVGHPYGSPVKEVELKYPILVEQELFEDRATAEYLRDDWSKLGITLELELVDTAQWNTQVYGYAHDLAMTYWSGDPDPNYLLYTQTTRAIGGWSENAYSSAEYDENYSLTISEQNHSKRVEYVYNCQRHTYNDCAFIVTVYPFGCYAWRNDTFDNWGDWEAHPFRTISNYYGANPLWFDLIPLEKPPPDGISLLAVGIGVGVLALIAVAIVLVLRRRKGGKEEKDVKLP